MPGGGPSKEITTFDGEAFIRNFPCNCTQSLSVACELYKKTATYIRKLPTSTKLRVRNKKEPNILANQNNRVRNVPYLSELKKVKWVDRKNSTKNKILKSNA